MVARENHFRSDEDNRQPTVSHQSDSSTCRVSHIPKPPADILHISTTYKLLHTSGWYWGSISAAEAKTALQDAYEGTFLVRDSSHPHYMLTLSVKTCCGATSVRIEYSCGLFRLDAIASTRSSLLCFPNIPSLVQHYVGAGQNQNPSQRRGEGQAELAEEEDGSWESGPPNSRALLLKLRHPLHRPHSFPSLQHLTRLVINRHASSPALLPLPRPLLLFLLEYPFCI